MLPSGMDPSRQQGTHIVLNPGLHLWLVVVAADCWCSVFQDIQIWEGRCSGWLHPEAWYRWGPRYGARWWFTGIFTKTSSDNPSRSHTVSKDWWHDGSRKWSQSNVIPPLVAGCSIGYKPCLLHVSELWPTFFNQNTCQILFLLKMISVLYGGSRWF